MANRGGHHVDAVTERRLKPIYDNLDNGNYKTAIQMADKVLKKHKDLQCAKVLKALALLRIGKRNESLGLTQDVMATKPVDEPTLQALSICFREMQKPEQIIELYTTALKSNPTNEEFHTHLFMALVRVGDYKRQQQVAKDMYKVFPKNPYYFWGVMSTVLQALTSTDEKLAQTMYLPLAEKMVERMVKERRMEAEAEVNIYLMILGYLNKHEKAIEVLDGEMGKFLKAEVDACPIRKAELLCKMGRWAEANSAYKILLTKSPDNWLFCKQYFKTALALIENNWSPPAAGESGSGNGNVSQPDYTIDMVLNFIQEKSEAEKRAAKEGHALPRGIFLSGIQLLRILKEKESPHILKMGPSTELFKCYFDLFGDRPCCYDDLCQFLPLIAPEDHQGFVQSLLDTLEMELSDDGMKYAKSVKQIYRHLCILKISRRLGLQDNLSQEEKLTLAKELIKRSEAAQSYGKDLLCTDLQYGDEYLLMAVHLLIDIWEETGEDKYLWRMLGLLENGLSSSSSCHHMKLLLIRLYCLAGAFGPIPDLYDGLDIKHIQQDTLGYTVSGYVTSLGHFTSATALFNTTLKFFNSNHKDTTEYMITAYKFGTFHKIPEFLTFRQRISNSLHRTLVTVEKLLLELLTEAEIAGNTLRDFVVDMDIHPEKDNTKWEEISDNRDLDIMVSWAPEHRQLSEEDRRASSQQEKSWLKVRQLTLRSLAAATYLTPNSPSTPDSTPTNNGEGPSYEKVLAALTDELDRHLVEVAEDPTTHRKFPIQGPPCTRMVNYLKGNCGKIFLMALRVTLSIRELSMQQDDNAELQSTIEQAFTSITDKFSESLRRSRRCLIREDGESRHFDRQVLPELALLVETLAFVILLAGVKFRLLKPMKAAALRKSRKKKGGATAKMPIFQHFKDYTENVQQLANGLTAAVQDIDPTMLSLDLGKLKLSESSLENQETSLARAESTVWKRIEKSYHESSKEILEVLKGKRDFLATLKL
ncbi:N-alpha-acetyltransferase 25, NatB auxiliary subunit-like isoform X2 [Acanthaster planci]|uniref:N-alpha-acetyltransferase 25, NatB auxiliary subunit-like isoform X2 n=1 Tax=Acanthaster planci TaxID=133434 RepID=A0A8B7XZZ3_ACAPL|nr:N-alpha-acetyltransferase 25, NatB auxiliary subunit-like isoform X2 [Acanthaster planci]